MLGRKKRASGGFGSTGSCGNKIFVSTVKDQVVFESTSVSVNDKVIIDISNIDKIIINSDLSESNSDNSEEINLLYFADEQSNNIFVIIILHIGNPFYCFD